jgi:hypothetical protein
VGYGVVGPHTFIITKVDEGEGVYRVLKKLYEGGSDSGSQNRAFVKSLCEEERYVKNESRLQKAGKKQRVYHIIHRLNVLNLSMLAKEAEKEEITGDELDLIIADLKSRGLIYEPEPGFLGFAGE